MPVYIIKRIALLFPVLFVVLLVAFFLVRLGTGDFAHIYWRMHAGNRSPTHAELEAIRVEMGLNDALIVQFFRWVGDVARLRLGKTLYTKEEVSTELAARLPYTAMLTGAAVLLAATLAFPLGVISAARPGSIADGLARILASSGIAMPQFWLALLLIYFVGFKMRLLPQLGSGTPLHLVLPALTLAAGPAATLTRLIRANMLEQIGCEFVDTAYAKGLSKTRVLLKHVLRPALVPVITFLGLQLGFIFGDSVIVETVFSWPGIGKWAVDGIFDHDMPILRAYILLMGCVFVFVNLLIDILYVWIDPRVRYQ